MRNEKPLHWWIQKPKAHNCPLKINGAVFEEFEPTVHELNCEWIKVAKYSAYESSQLENRKLQEEVRLLRDKVERQVYASNHVCPEIEIRELNQKITAAITAESIKEGV